LLGLVALLAIIPAFLSPAFRTSQNVSNILNQIAPIGFVALGQTLPILTKGIDLSVGPLVSLTTVLAATLMGFDTSSVLTGLLICLAVGLAVGLVNGFLLPKPCWGASATSFLTRSFTSPWRRC